MERGSAEVEGSGAQFTSLRVRGLLHLRDVPTTHAGVTMLHVVVWQVREDT